MIGAARAARLNLHAAIRAVMTVVVVRRGIGAAVGTVRRGLRRDRLMHCAPTIDSEPGNTHCGSHKILTARHRAADGVPGGPSAHRVARRRQPWGSQVIALVALVRLLT